MNGLGKGRPFPAVATDYQIKATADESRSGTGGEAATDPRKKPTGALLPRCRIIILNLEKALVFEKIKRSPPKEASL